MTSYHAQRRASLIARYVLLALLAALWLFPIVWIVLASFSYNDTGFVSTIWPKQFTLSNYTGIFTSTQFPFVYWIRNTLFVSLVSMVLSTFVTISVAYALSRLRFRFRKPYLQIALVLGMFPGFMSMIALYYILKSFNMRNLGGLILVYVGGAGLGFYIAKGFFDTIPRSIDEAAEIDGAGKIRQFLAITVPMLTPITFYHLITSVIGGLQAFMDTQLLADTRVTQTIVYFIYDNGINNYRYGYASAASVLLAIAVMIITVLQFKLSDKWVYSE